MTEMGLHDLRLAIIAYVDTPRTMAEIEQRFKDQPYAKEMIMLLVKEKSIMIDPGSNGRTWTQGTRARLKREAMA